MIVIALALVLGATSAIPTNFHVTKVTRTPPETVKTTVAYDSGTRDLTIACDSASMGECRFTIVDGARTRKIVLRPKSRLVVAGVSGKARMCAVGKSAALACELAPVTT